MPDTFAALVIIALAVLPGGLYTWMFEREVGGWGSGIADRTLRLIGVSSAFLALLAWPSHLLWTHYLHQPVAPTIPGSRGAYRNLVHEGPVLPWWLYLIPIGYVALPVAVGFVAGQAVRKRRAGASRSWRVVAASVAGRDPAPRAWDHVFLAHPAAIVRVRLREGGGYIGGLFGASSYASGFGASVDDLYLEKVYVMNSDGTFAEGNAPGGFQSIGSSLLILRSDILHLEFFSSATHEA